MKLRILINNFTEHKAFWQARALSSKLVFVLSRWAFGLLDRRDQEYADSNALRGIVRGTAPQLLLALSAAVLAQVANPHLQNVYEFLGWKAPDEGIYGSLLAAVSSVGAVFIGLYYAGLSAVGTATYARLPHSVRELLVRERMGTSYMRFLAFITFFSLVMLCLRVLGYPQVAIAIPIVSLLAGVGIFGFVSLGQRAFNLFDPVTVSDATFLELHRLVNRVSAGGFRWKDPSFQNHARQRADASLDAAEALNAICSSENHLSEQSRLSLVTRLNWFLMRYQRVKNKIPTESYWFARMSEHPSWYRSDDSATMIAHQTGTSLRSTEVVDLDWIESRLIPMLLGALNDFVESKRIDEAVKVLSAVEGYLTVLAEHGEIASALKILDGAARATIASILRNEKEFSSESLKELALMELIGSIPIGLCLRYREMAGRLVAPLEDVAIDALAKSNWRSTYQGVVHIKVRQRFEWLADRLSIERLVEGRVISPPWYVRELLYIVAADVHADGVIALNGAVENLYRQWGQMLKEKNRPWLSAALLSREREYLSKLETSDPEFQRVWEILVADRRIPGLIWPDLDFAMIATQRVLYKKSLIPGCLDALSELGSQPRPNLFPDYFGQFLHAAGEDAFDALLDGDSGRFASLFPFCFTGSFLTFANLNQQTSKNTDQILRTVQIAAGATLDLFELSGYAKLMAGYYNDTELWTLVENKWEEYFNVKTTPTRVGFVAAILGVVQSSFSIPMRGILRTTWSQKIEHKLRDLPRREIYRKGSMSLSSQTLIQHSDPLVRVCADAHIGLAYEGKDIFMELYIKTRSDASTVKFPRDRDLKRALKEEIDFYEHNKNAV
jgi:hypothetical protein